MFFSLRKCFFEFLFKTLKTFYINLQFIPLYFLVLYIFVYICYICSHKVIILVKFLVGCKIYNFVYACNSFKYYTQNFTFKVSVENVL